MKIKVVYVLVSSINDYYTEQALLSIKSLICSNSDVYVSVVLDRVTEESLALRQYNISLYVDELVVVDVEPAYTGAERSRILKTNLRNYVNGDFLFIDTDTVVCGDLSSIEDCPYDMAAVADAHVDYGMNPYKHMIKRNLKSINCELPTECENYYNSGVIFVKDNERTRAFYDLWLKNWKEGRRLGVRMDQPSFYKTNKQLDLVKELQPEWNAQLKHAIQYADKAKIIHYLCTANSGSDSLIKCQTVSFLNEIKTGNLDVIDEFLNNGVIEAIRPRLSEVLIGEDVNFFHIEVVEYMRKLYLQNSGIIRIANSILALIRTLRRR